MLINFLKDYWVYDDTACCFFDLDYCSLMLQNGSFWHFPNAKCGTWGTTKPTQSPKVETRKKENKTTLYDIVKVERSFCFTERNSLERETQWQAPEEVASTQPCQILDNNPHLQPS
ncbi:hypothetical protein VNO77_07289 [Canavalia gladiata]|uniref:Uncharacterized protein n=1 Tax=Canavalia gladiata TaxID=3824 RepID=A0AAN9ME62_CANGL